jgi:hypothetical protein
MTTIDYIGFDIHKKTISFSAKAQDGTILARGRFRPCGISYSRGPRRDRGPGSGRWKRRCLPDGALWEYTRDTRYPIALHIN